MNLPYDGNIPAAGNAPSADQPVMQTNASSISSLISVDHYGFQNSNGGYHNVIHLVTQPSNPSAIANLGQLFSKVKGGDTQLFYKSGNNVLTQLTGGNSSVGYRGYTWLPGDVLIQWGYVNGSHGSNNTFSPGDSGSVTFNIPFPNQVYNVTTNVNYNSSTAGVPASSSSLIIAPNYYTTSTSGFGWVAAGSGGSYTVFYWFAIGS